MSTKTYDTLEGELTVRGAATISRSGDTNAVAIVGGYDSANADSEITAGESTRIDDPNSADDLFGTSELSRQAPAVAANGITDIYGVPVPETETTESISSGNSITLSNTPIFDPTVHPDESITVTDTDTGNDLTVNVVYESSPSQPSESDTANVNPINGEVEIDASGNYDVEYTYGDYTTAIEAAADLTVRGVLVCTESPSVTATLQTELEDRATDFDFSRGYVNATPEIAVGDISSYTPHQEDWRIVEIAPARGEGADGEIRTVGAFGGHLCSQPIGPDGSGLYEPVGGLESLNTEYRASEAKDFSQVSVLTRNGEVGQAVTTSPEAQFRNIYATEIIDAVALGLFGTARDYAGGPQDIGELGTLLRTQLGAFASGSPPLLGFGDGRSENPYDVSTSLGADSSVANANVSIVPFPVAEEVNLGITVTDGFVQFDGAN